MEFADVRGFCDVCPVNICPVCMEDYGLIDNDASYLQWIGYGMGAASALYFYLDQAE